MNLKNVAIFLGGTVFGAFATMKLLEFGMTEMAMEGKFDMQRYSERDGKWHVITKSGLEINDERKEFQ